MRPIKRIVFCSLIMLFFVTIISCAKTPTLSITYPKAEIIIGETIVANVTITPSKENQKFTFVSSDSAVATVDVDGKLTGVAVGSVSVTVSLEKNKKVASTSTSISVKEQKASGLTISLDKNLLVVGSTTTIHTNLTPDNATNKTFVYTSNNPQVLSVNAQGVITALSPGSTTVKVTSNSTPALIEETEVIYVQTQEFFELKTLVDYNFIKIKQFSDKYQEDYILDEGLDSDGFTTELLSQIATFFQDPFLLPKYKSIEDIKNAVKTYFTDSQNYRAKSGFELSLEYFNYEDFFTDVNLQSGSIPINSVVAKTTEWKIKDSGEDRSVTNYEVYSKVEGVWSLIESRNYKIIKSPLDLAKRSIDLSYDASYKYRRFLDKELYIIEEITQEEAINKNHYVTEDVDYLDEYKDSFVFYYIYYDSEDIYYFSVCLSYFVEGDGFHGYIYSYDEVEPITIKGYLMGENFEYISDLENGEEIFKNNNNYKYYYGNYGESEDYQFYFVNARKFGDSPSINYYVAVYERLEDHSYNTIDDICYYTDITELLNAQDLTIISEYDGDYETLITAQYYQAFVESHPNATILLHYTYKTELGIVPGITIISFTYIEDGKYYYYQRYTKYSTLEGLEFGSGLIFNEKLSLDPKAADSKFNQDTIALFESLYGSATYEVYNGILANKNANILLGYVDGYIIPITYYFITE